MKCKNDILLAGENPACYFENEEKLLSTFILKKRNTAASWDIMVSHCDFMPPVGLVISWASLPQYLL